MRTKLAWIFTVALLAIANIAAEAQVKVIFGDDGKESYYGTGGKITYSQTKPDNGKVTVTITASPNEGFTINKEDIHVYEVISPNMTRAGEPPVLGKRLDLDGPKGSRSEKTDYSVTIDAKLGLWVKKATFNNSGGSKAGTSDDYSGTYYIGSVGYNASKTTTNYYLCPTEGWAFFVSDDTNPGKVQKDDNKKPFLTTYKCRSSAYHSGDPSDAVWTIEKAPAPNSDYYYIKQTSTGRYMVFNGIICINPDRARVHLEEINAPNVPGDSALFSIYSPKDKDYLVIKVKSFKETTSDVPSGSTTHLGTHDNHKWLVVNQGNKDDLAGTNARTDGPTNFKNTGGIISLYTETDTNVPFYLEIPSPAISQDPTTLDISMELDWTGATIRYTTDGTEPTKTSTFFEGEFLPEIGTSTVKAKAFNSSGDVASATTSFELTKNTAPTITVDMSTKKATISTTVEGGTIYYTTDGKNPTVSSSVYSDPISFTEPTTIKAIVGKVGYGPSAVTTKDIIKVGTPQLYDNGNLAIAITSATVGASIYYTIDGTTPSRSSSLYSAPLTNMEGKTIKAFAVKAECFDSDVATFGPVSFSCAQPIIKRTGANTFTLTCSNPKSGTTIYYTTNGDTPTTSDSHVNSGEAVSFDTSQLPFTVKAIAVADGLGNSSEASLTISNDGMSGSGTSADPYQIALDSDFSIFATKVNTGGEASACFIVTNDINASGAAEITTPFTGTFDGDGYTINNLGHALFNAVNGGTVKNVMLDAVSISGGTNVGAIANKVTGTSAQKAAIYNCGVLSGSVSGSDYVGSIVGQLGDSNNDNCYARVINCFSYATIDGGSRVGGIVGYNDFASASNNLRTMVMNCMFYGKITGGSNKAPIYNGENITNVGTNGLANYNYYYSGCTFNGGIDTYNCALAADERYLTRFEFYRRLLNSNGELAAWYATGSTDNRSEMYKWILLPSSYGTEHPFPVLAPQGIYPSVVNIDAENATTQTERNKGGLLGSISVTISGPGSGAVFGAPAGASITNGSLTLNITDKDYDHFNYNYRKVQLPYYNEVGTGNCSGNRVVTGWKITSITGGTAGSYSTGDDVTFTDGELTATPYNFADRKCTNKDLFSVSGRIFSQGAYWDVPDGVTSITIEPYWGKAAYLCDQYWNVVYTQDHKTQYNVTPMGVHYTNATDYFIEGTWQKVYNSLDNAVSALSSNADHKVYDYAVVLVGNYHLVKQANPIRGGTVPFTVMSADFDKDNEPDYSFIMQFSSRQNTAPIRFDFINIPGLGMAQKSFGAQSMPNVGIFKPNGWFEITNTATILLGQFEYDRKDKVLSPLILHGGIIEQIVSNNDGSSPLNKTQYMHLGSNVWFANFSPGIHQDKTTATKHVPVSVTGGEYNEFHLTGTYRADATVNDDNAECYIHGGKFGEITGTGLEGIGTTNGKGNITWVIDQADITNFFGGGINAAKPSLGNIYTEITNSHVTLFCGGPKFGDMQTGKTVTTKATDCTFGTFFGAGYGGNSYNRFSPQNKTNDVNYAWNTWVNENYTCAYSSDADKNGISTNFDYEFIPMSGGMSTNVARLFVNYLSFSLATCRNVTSSLTGCTIKGNFYGGGSLGKVDGDATSTLTNCTLEQSAFGAGFSATLPTVEVMATGGFTPEPHYDPDGGVYSSGVFPETTTYRWEHAASPSIDKTNHILYTTADLTTLGTVTGDVTLTINGTTTVAGSVYGGGEESNVMGNTNVTMTDGYVFNGIFGGGYSGSVGTFTRSTEEADVNIFGHTTHDGCIGKPKSCAANTGKCTVVVTGGQIGPIEVATLGMKRPASQGGPVPEGWVWGGGCGIIEDPKTHPDTHFKTYVGSTDVTIGGHAFILESIIGGGEFGRVLGDTHVTIEGNCQIGVGEDQVDGDKPKRYADEKFIDPTTTTITSDKALPECSHFEYGSDFDGDGNPEYLTFDPYYDKYYDATSGSHKDNIPDGLKLGSTSHPSDGKTWIGCVFGGGSGYMPYEKKDESGYGWVRSAGWVGGNTSVEIKGGHILTNVYGANEYSDVEGKSTVKMSGGTVGVPRTLEQIKANPLNGNIFGAGKGDPRTYFNTSTNVGSTEVEITGGIVYGSVYGGGEDGHVIDNAVTTIKKETGEGKKAPVIGCDGTAGNNGNVFGGGEGAAIALTAGVVGGNITLNILDGHIKGSVYGGGELASVGTYFAMANDPNYGLMQEGDNHGCIAVNLKGGSIYQNVYGGCMGTNENDALGISKNVTVNLNKGVADNAQGCVVKGNIFGCNNVNSSPEGTVTVYVYGTQHEGKSQIANTNGDSPVTDAKTKGSYDVHAVYGGGNMAAYTPKDLTTGTTDVVIYGCGRTSIRQVYGGGNAASTPATKVTVNGTFEIEELFGGGNGKDSIIVNNVKKANPGANVGFKDYSAVESTYDTKEKRQQEAFVNTYVYGTGQASVNVFGGTIHRVFGGSNTKGNVRQTAVTMLEEAGGCEFCVDEAYGGGKSAPMDAEAKLLMSCIPGLQAAYGGAEAADILGNVTLNITNGTFDRVFGGNNLSGTISGSITVNIEEVGCKPVKIGELYGGGNQAAYSVYGYDNGTIKESGTKLYNDPVVNVKSFTSIGSVFGGGYGEGATLVGNPTVNINEVYGKYYNDDASVVGENAKTSGNYPIPSHAKGKMGAINNVFGGGNAARVIGNTTVNIGTRDKIDYVTTESGESTPRTNITVVGADIRGNVYGGGNNAEVTGNAEVVIGEKKTE